LSDETEPSHSVDKSTKNRQSRVGYAAVHQDHD